MSIFSLFDLRLLSNSVLHRLEGNPKVLKVIDINSVQAVPAGLEDDTPNRETADERATKRKHSDEPDEEPSTNTERPQNPNVVWMAVVSDGLEGLTAVRQEQLTILSAKNDIARDQLKISSRTEDREQEAHTVKIRMEEQRAYMEETSLIGQWLSSGIDYLVAQAKLKISAREAADCLAAANPPPAQPSVTQLRSSSSNACSTPPVEGASTSIQSQSPGTPVPPRSFSTPAPMSSGDPGPSTITNMLCSAGINEATMEDIPPSSSVGPSGYSDV